MVEAFDLGAELFAVLPIGHEARKVGELALKLDPFVPELSKREGDLALTVRARTEGETLAALFDAQELVDRVALALHLEMDAEHEAA
jgi:hypothetical protein